MSACYHARNWSIEKLERSITTPVPNPSSTNANGFLMIYSHFLHMKSCPYDHQLLLVLTFFHVLRQVKNCLYFVGLCAVTHCDESASMDQWLTSRAITIAYLQLCTISHDFAVVKAALLIL